MIAKLCACDLTKQQHPSQKVPLNLNVGKSNNSRKVSDSEYINF